MHSITKHWLFVSWIRNNCRRQPHAALVRPIDFGAQRFSTTWTGRSKTIIFMELKTTLTEALRMYWFQISCTTLVFLYKITVSISSASKFRKNFPPRVVCIFARRRRLPKRTKQRQQERQQKEAEATGYKPPSTFPTSVFELNALRGSLFHSWWNSVRRPDMLILSPWRSFRNDLRMHLK